MEKLDLKIFGKRLKEIAKADFEGIGKLAQEANINNLSTYTSGSREAGSQVLYRLAMQGIDLNKLIVGKQMGNNDTECKCDELRKELKACQEVANEVINLKALMFDMAEEQKKLKEENEVLLRQIVVLDKAIELKRSSSP